MINGIMIGRIGKDAEVVNRDNKKYVAMDVATDIFYRGENKTDWVRVYCNKPQIIKIVEEKGQFKKGSMVEVRGTVTTPSSWVSKKTGEVCAQNVMLADHIQYSGGRKKADKPNGEETKDIMPEQKQQMPFEPKPENDDLPF